MTLTVPSTVSVADVVHETVVDVLVTIAGKWRTGRVVSATTTLKSAFAVPKTSVTLQ